MRSVAQASVAPRRDRSSTINRGLKPPATFKHRSAMEVPHPLTESQSARNPSSLKQHRQKLRQIPAPNRPRVRAFREVPGVVDAARFQLRDQLFIARPPAVVLADADPEQLQLCIRAG